MNSHAAANAVSNPTMKTALRYDAKRETYAIEEASVSEPLVLVINPRAGRGRAEEAGERLRTLLTQRGRSVRIIYTSPDPKEFLRRCQTISPNACVVCIGGDGTLRKFLNARPSFKRVTMLGMGTGNVFALEFDLKKDPDSILDLLEKGRTLAVYPGELQDGRRFLMMCGYGLDGAIIAASSQRLKNRWGKLAFIPAFFSAFIRYRFPRVTVVADGKRYETEFALVSRIRHYGGHYLVAPDADPCKRRFQVLIQTGHGRIGALRAIWALCTGRTTKSSAFETLFAETVDFQDIKPGSHFQIDGDLSKRPVVRCKISNDSVDFIVPSARKSA